METKILAVILIAGVLLVGGYLFYGNNVVPTVSAYGQSSLEVEPDEVSVYLNIETRADTAQEAQEANAEIKDTLLTELIKIGILREDIQLQSYNVREDYDWSAGSRTFKGFVASQSVIVKASDFTKVSGIIDKSVESGALVSWINFELSEEKQNEYKAQALEKAGEDAKLKAESTAKGLDKKLGKLVSVESSDFNYYPYMFYEAGVSSGDAKSATMNINPMDLSVTASIKVVYKLR